MITNYILAKQPTQVDYNACRTSIAGTSCVGIIKQDVEIKANNDCKCKTVSKMNITTVFITTGTKWRLIGYQILQISSKNSVKMAKITSFYDIILVKFVPKSCYFTVKWELFPLGYFCVIVTDNGLLSLWIDRGIKEFMLFICFWRRFTILMLLWRQFQCILVGESPFFANVRCYIAKQLLKNVRNFSQYLPK